MDKSEIVRLLKIERECVRRNSDEECDRECGMCPLVQDDMVLLEMYDEAINIIRKDIVRKEISL